MSVRENSTVRSASTGAVNLGVRRRVRINQGTGDQQSATMCMSLSARASRHEHPGARPAAFGTNIRPAVLHE